MRIMNVVLCTLLTIALTYIIINRLTDVVYSLVDPRIRYE